MSKLSVEAIAKVCHEINKAYCEALGDDSQPEWENAPDWQVASSIDLVEFNLANPDSPPSHSHDNWLRERGEAGWIYGPVKDVDKKEHPCFIPYEDLPVEQKAKDYLFHQVVKSLSQI